ncbi:hypothetical protein L1887_22581 [Cichorium endivia]|nr:hypothetical protein L1887_22581 [Cichorium endivia]
MVQISRILKKALVLVAIKFSMAATVSTQATTPAHSPDTGVAVSVPDFGAVIGKSMLLSIAALFRHWFFSFNLNISCGVNQPKVGVGRGCQRRHGRLPVPISTGDGDGGPRVLRKLELNSMVALSPSLKIRHRTQSSRSAIQQRFVTGGKFDVGKQMLRQDEANSKWNSTYQAVTIILLYKNQNQQNSSTSDIYFPHLQEMAQISSIVKKVSLIAVVAFSVAATVSAQATAPAPSPDAGSSFSVPVSGVVIGSSMLLSLVALFRH